MGVGKETYDEDDGDLESRYPRRSTIGSRLQKMYARLKSKNTTESSSSSSSTTSRRGRGNEQQYLRLGIDYY